MVVGGFCMFLILMLWCYCNFVVVIGVLLMLGFLQKVKPYTHYPTTIFSSSSPPHSILTILQTILFLPSYFSPFHFHFLITTLTLFSLSHPFSSSSPSHRLPQTLLSFMKIITAQSHHNRMTEESVCMIMAPNLFLLPHPSLSHTSSG